MRLVLEIFAFLYLIAGTIVTALLRPALFNVGMLQAYPKAAVPELIVAIASWPSWLMGKFGSIWTGYGFMGAAVLAISLIVLYALAWMFANFFTEGKM